MTVLKEVGRQLDCFVLGVDHYGKDVAAGTRGSSAKEASADLVLACLGDREQSGSVTNTRLAVRKCRGGPQGQEFYFAVRKVEDPTPDEDGDPVTTLVIDWVATPATATPSPQDPWAAARRQDQRTAVLRLKRILFEVLAKHGTQRPIGTDRPEVRVVDQQLVRERFYASTPADGTPEQKGRLRRQTFLNARDWAEREQLIGISEIDDVTYLWLSRSDPEPDEHC